MVRCCASPRNDGVSRTPESRRRAASGIIAVRQVGAELSPRHVLLRSPWPAGCSPPRPDRGTAAAPAGPAAFQRSALSRLPSSTSVCAEAASLRKWFSVPENCLRSAPGERGAMIEPVEPGDDGYRQVDRRVAGEFDHRFIVRQLAKIGVQDGGLRIRLGEQREFAPRHRQQIAQGLEPGVIADRWLIPMCIRSGSLAGGIDQLAAVGLVQILFGTLLDIRKQRQRAIRCRRTLSERPPIHGPPNAPADRDRKAR